MNDSIQRSDPLTPWRILGVLGFAFATGVWLFGPEKKAAARRKKSVVPAEPDYVVPDIDDSMQAAIERMDQEFPGAKSCYRQGSRLGSAREPHVGFHELYRIYEYTGRPPGGPRWIAAFAWRSPTGQGNGAPGSDNIDFLWGQINDAGTEGQRAWDELSADVRGTWEDWSGAC